MAEGTVKWFNPEKTLDEGAAVQFDVTTGQNGKLQASNVTKA